MARNFLVTVGSDEFAATCPSPRLRIGFFEAIGLTVRGWLDAAANRGVSDHRATHTIHWLQARHLEREHEVDRRLNAVLTAVDRALADTDVILTREVPADQPVPASSELETLHGADRTAWTNRVRAARAANGAADAARGAQAAAARRREELFAIREGLWLEAEDLRGRWAEAYRRRAARYTRARFSLRGARPSEAPEVPLFPHTPGPTVARRVPAQPESIPF